MGTGYAVDLLGVAMHPAALALAGSLSLVGSAFRRKIVVTLEAPRELRFRRQRPRNVWLICGRPKQPRNPMPMTGGVHAARRRDWCAHLGTREQSAGAHRRDR